MVPTRRYVLSRSGGPGHLNADELIPPPTMKTFNTCTASATWRRYLTVWKWPDCLRSGVPSPMDVVNKTTFKLVPALRCTIHRTPLHVTKASHVSRKARNLLSHSHVECPGGGQKGLDKCDIPITPCPFVPALLIAGERIKWCLTNPLQMRENRHWPSDPLTIRALANVLSGSKGRRSEVITQANSLTKLALDRLPEVRRHQHTGDFI